MAAKIINGNKYICLYHDNTFKSKSFEDNLYFTLKDIWLNIEINEAIRVSYYMSLLTGSIPFEQRTETFKYNDITVFAKPIYNYLTDLCLHKDANGEYKLMKDALFDFYNIDDWEDDEKSEIYLKDYMKYDDWWLQFETLYYQLEKNVKSKKIMT
jgi:hypothetical protein